MDGSPTLRGFRLEAKGRALILLNERCETFQEIVVIALKKVVLARKHLGQ